MLNFGRKEFQFMRSYSTREVYFLICSFAVKSNDELFMLRLVCDLKVSNWIRVDNFFCNVGDWLNCVTIFRYQTPNKTFCFVTWFYQIRQ